ncbi:hypothetical protein MXB_5429 [Myxobolus squamalis]|nr:hypothetical protein MXB_5429 [Myxobolus squamalis]
MELYNHTACSHPSTCLGRYSVFLSFQDSVGVKPTKNTAHLLPIEIPNLKSISSWDSFTIFMQKYTR